MESTLVLLKPDAVRRSLVGEILTRIERKGYELAAIRMLEATPEQLARHYAELVEREFYPGIVEYMTSAPIVAVEVRGQRVVEGVRALTGPTDPTSAPPGTIRGDFGRDVGADVIENLIHSSDSPESANTELAIWF